MRRFFFVAFLLFLANNSLAQQLPEAVLDQVQTVMSALEVNPGTWEGTGSMTMGPGQVHGSTVHESGQYRLDRTVFMIEGIGHATEDVYGNYLLVHNELNIISNVVHEQNYFMRAYRLGGQFVDAKVEIDGNVLQWGFETPGVGKISRDGGETSFPFFEMSLA